MNVNTNHKIHIQSSNEMTHLIDESIDLIVTSPPYPMIEMWDQAFIANDSAIEVSWFEGKYYDCFESMHQQLDTVWKECFRVVKPGGIVCINIGDSTRSLEGNFFLFPNHARIIQAFVNLGFTALPHIYWRKSTTSPNKFMGSGMMPPGAYVTMEHEHILIFRKGEKRVFESEQEKVNRRQSAYFWEDRNKWFSDVWIFHGARQKFEEEIRMRSAAFPFELPYRLINMYSVKGDWVLDPFLGTGTTSMAAIASQRNSIGYERDQQFGSFIDSSITNSKEILNQVVEDRLAEHRLFVKQRNKEKGESSLKHINQFHNFPIVTQQEKWIQLLTIEEIETIQEHNYSVSYNI